MTGSALFRLVRLNISRDRKGALSSIFGVTMGVGALVFFVALGLGISRVVREKVFPVDMQLVEVVPSPVSLGGLLGSGKIDQSVVDRLTALAGVRQSWRKMTVRVPAVSRYDGDFFGSKLHMGIEVIAVGVDPGLVKADVQLGDFTDQGPGKPIPALPAARLLEIYNKSFAPARGLPSLSPSLVVGFQFPVEFNRSFVAATKPGPTIESSLQLVGVSDRGLLAGLTIPLDTAKRINAASGVDAESFSAVTLEADSPGRVAELAATVKTMGLKVDEADRKLAQNAGAAVTITTSAMALLSFLICLLAAVNIAHALSASVRARAKELGVMRAVGASKRDVRALVFAEAGTLGLVGGVIGTAFALLSTIAIDAAAMRFLPDFPFRPDTFFGVPWYLPLLGIGLGLVAALVGAFGAGRAAASLDPSRTLAG